MSACSWICLIVVVLLVLPVNGSPRRHQLFEYVRGCYYTNWSQYRQDKGRYTPEHYIPGLCTHIFYAFVTMDDNFQLKPFEWNDDSADGIIGNYRRVNELKKLQPDLKTLLSFGGYTFSQANAKLLSRMAATGDTRKSFITSVIGFIRERDFDGFDMDWEYPTEEDKQNFAILLKELREAFELEAHETGKPRLLLTAAVAAGTEKIDAGYDATIMAKVLDYVNVMSYDFHGSWEMITGFNSPLYDRNDDRLSVSSAATLWVSKGIPRKKLLIGFGTYARGWVLSGPEKGVGAPAMNPSPAQNYTKEAGVAAYYEMCQLLADRAATRTYDVHQRAPYSVKDKVWFGYDDEESFDEKLAWLKKNGYGGAFVWTLDQDDFNGQCPGGDRIRYPLISKIAHRLGKELPIDILKVNVTPSKAPEPWSPSPSIFPSIPFIVSTEEPLLNPVINSSLDFHCHGLGLFADPTSCKSYYNCGQPRGPPFKMSCSDGTVFNPSLKLCDWPSKVDCKIGR